MNALHFLNKTFRMAILAVLLSPAVTVLAANIDISGFYNTGVNNQGQALTQGEVDPHYQIASYTGSDAYGNTIFPAPAYVQTNPNNWPVGNPWVPPMTPISNWITPGTTAGQSFDSPTATNGVYAYTTHFSELGATPSISGLFTADNSAEAILNGHVIGTAAGPTAFSQWYAFGTSNARYFNMNAVNTLTFVVTNTANNYDNPTGLQVTSSPLPTALFFVAPALAGVFGFLRRKAA